MIIGAGFIGLEMAESLADLWGIETDIVEITGQLLPGIISPNMARMARHHLEEKGVTLFFNEAVDRIEGERRVEKVVTGKRTIDADMVIIAAGILPCSELARDSGLEISPAGAVVVNRRMQTSDPDIYAGGTVSR